MSEDDRSPEEWILDTICAGKIADFNTKLGHTLNPIKQEGWDSKRKVSSEFLRRIFLEKAIDIPFEGVRIIGAFFPEGVTLEYGRLQRTLLLNQCRFDKPIIFSELQTDGSLSLRNSFISGQKNEEISIELSMAIIKGALDLTSINLSGYLNMNGSTVAKTMQVQKAILNRVNMVHAKIDGELSFENASIIRLDLGGAKIGGHLILNDTTVESELTMNDLIASRDLSIKCTKEKATKFNKIKLIDAKISGHLMINNAVVKSELNMNDLIVERDLSMEASEFGKVELENGRINGHLILNGATISDGINMDNIFIGRSFYAGKMDIEKTEFGKSMTKLTSATIKESFDLSNVQFTQIDMSSTRVEGEFNLGSSDRSSDGCLILRNAYAGTLLDRCEEIKNSKSESDAWPKFLQLDGFTYNRLSGAFGSSMLNRSDRWYIQWLARHKPYLPQPYEQLADTLRKAGEPAKANRILFESRERARETAKEKDWGRFIGLTLINWTMGYGLGLRYFRCFGWIAGLIAVGVFVLSTDPQQSLTPLGAKIAYSLQKLLPIVELEKFDNIHLSGFATGYFYLHRLFGYTLVAFLAAGIAGLTQRSPKS